MNFFSRKPPGGPAHRKRIGEAVLARLQANPAAQPVAATDTDVFVVPRFITPEQCLQLIAVIDERNRPSTLMAPAATNDFRTSQSCDMNRWRPEIQQIDHAIADLFGQASRFGETIQGQRYQIGQQFRAHHDYFAENAPYYTEMQKVGGQRTWTAMIYLNEVEEGGATWFPKAGVRVKPQTGLLLAWNNMTRAGTPNENTLHEGMPVTRGTKYIVTKWFRERPWLDLPS